MSFSKNKKKKTIGLWNNSEYITTNMDRRNDIATTETKGRKPQCIQLWL